MGTNFKDRIKRALRALGWTYPMFEVVECEHDWTPIVIMLPELQLAGQPIMDKDGKLEVPICCTKCYELRVANWVFTSKEAKDRAGVNAEMAKLQETMPNVKPGDFR